MPYNEKLTRE